MENILPVAGLLSRLICSALCLRDFSWKINCTSSNRCCALAVKMLLMHWELQINWHVFRQYLWFFLCEIFFVPWFRSLQSFAKAWIGNKSGSLCSIIPVSHFSFLTHKVLPICIYIQELHQVITVPADVPAPHGARPSAGTVITAQLYVDGLAICRLLTQWSYVFLALTHQYILYEISLAGGESELQCQMMSFKMSDEISVNLHPSTFKCQNSPPVHLL